MGKTLHSPMAPAPRELAPRATGIADNGYPAGQADLASVGMTAEVQVDTDRPCLFYQFRRVDQEH